MNSYRNVLLISEDYIKSNSSLDDNVSGGKVWKGVS